MVKEVCSERGNSQIHYGRHKQVLLFFVIKSLDGGFAHVNFLVVFDTDSFCSNMLHVAAAGSS